MKKFRGLLHGIFCLFLIAAGMTWSQELYAVPTTRLFDFGHQDNPLWTGFERVDASAAYEASRGYGWVVDDSGAQGRRIEDRKMTLIRGHMLPDDLIGDWILWRGGADPLSFRVDIPDGPYMVGVWMGAVNGTYHYDHAAYTIRANGEDKVAFGWDGTSFRDRFFRGGEDKFEWRPGDDMWEKYIRDQMGQLHVFEAEARDGVLELSFVMPQDGGRRAEGEIHAVLAVAAILIQPAAQRSDFEARLTSIDVQRRQQFLAMCQLDIPKTERAWPKQNARYAQAGYVPFVRDLMKPLDFNTVPEDEEIGADLRIRAALGERALARFAIHPLKNLEDVRLSVTALEDEQGRRLPAEAVEWRWCRYLEQPIHYRRAVLDYRPVPTMLMPARASDIPEAMNRPFVVAVTPPVDTAPGVYRGKVQILAANAASMELPIKVRVDGFELETYDNDDERIWIYRPHQMYRAYGDQLMPEQEMWEWVDRDLALMRKYHIAPTLLFDWDAPAPDIERFMALWQKYGFRGHPLFGGYQFLAEVERPYRRGTNPDGRNYTRFIEKIREVEQAQQAHGWPRFAYYTTAEIHFGMPSYLAGSEALAIVKKAVPDAVLLSMPNRIEELEVMVESAADIVGPNAISMTEDGARMVHEAGKKLWFYGWGRQRFRCGLADWRVGSRGGVNEWYGSIMMSPMNPFDGSHEDGWNDAPPLFTSEGPIPTIGLERTTAGRVDFFYLATLEKWIDRVKAIESAQAEAVLDRARQTIDEIADRVNPSYYYYYQRVKGARTINQFDIPYNTVFGWSPADYHQMRASVAERILELRTIYDEAMASRGGGVGRVVGVQSRISRHAE